MRGFRTPWVWSAWQASRNGERAFPAAKGGGFQKGGSFIKPLGGGKLGGSVEGPEASAPNFGGGGCIRKGREGDGGGAEHMGTGKKGGKGRLRVFLGKERECPVTLWKVLR